MESTRDSSRELGKRLPTVYDAATIKIGLEPLLWLLREQASLSGLMPRNCSVTTVHSPWSLGNALDERTTVPWHDCSVQTIGLLSTREPCSRLLYSLRLHGAKIQLSRLRLLIPHSRSLLKTNCREPTFCSPSANPTLSGSPAAGEGPPEMFSKAQRCCAMINCTESCCTSAAASAGPGALHCPHCAS